MTKKTTFTHNDLAMDLSDHLRNNTQLMVWEDIPMGPVGSVRPDVFTLPKSFTRFTPLTYEVKVSVEDFRSDITSGKWINYLDFSAGVVFAAPAGLISKSDLPAGCGLIQRHKKVWRMAKAPTLNPVEIQNRDVWMKLLMGGIERETKRQKLLTRSTNHWIVERKLNKKYGEEVARLVATALFSSETLEVAIKNKEQVIDNIRDESHEAVKAAAIRREALDEKLDALAELVGLQAKGYTIQQLTRRLQSAIYQIDKDTEIARLRRAFADIAKTTQLYSQGLDERLSNE